MKEFDKIIGYKEIKQELEHLADMMQSPEKYKKLGASIPRGLLLTGNPGVGKTLMANCLIEASGRPSFVCRKAKQGDKFVDEITKTFQKAVAAAPSIVLLDDMDKYSNEDADHRNSDAFVCVQTNIDEIKDKDVFVIATINWVHSIPGSLMRSGRLERKIEVPHPSAEDAAAIVSFYLSQKSAADGLDARDIARMLHGGSCADLERVINEAAIYAAFENKQKIQMEHMVKACLRTLFDAPAAPENENSVLTTAYHEAGHVVASELLSPGSVSLVSICCHTGETAGFTEQVNEKDYWHKLENMENRVTTLLAGKAATELVTGDIDVGVAADLERARDILMRFTAEYAMFGFDKFLPDNRRGTPTLSYKIEECVNSHLNEYYTRARKLLAAHRDLLDDVAHNLIERKTLTSSQVQEIMARHA